MRIIGRWEPAKQPSDRRKYVAYCNNADCRCIFEFIGDNIKYIQPEGVEYKGEFGMICKTHPNAYYAVKCPGCDEYVDLGDNERRVLQHLKRNRERERALDKYDEEHDVDYD